MEKKNILEILGNQFGIIILNNNSFLRLQTL